MNNTVTNRSTIILITTAVAIMAFSCVVTICTLAYFGIAIPPELNTLAGTLSGGLAGMLVKTAPTETTKQPPPSQPPFTHSGKPPEVVVVNKPDKPVPTTEENK